MSRIASSAATRALASKPARERFGVADLVLRLMRQSNEQLVDRYERSFQLRAAIIVCVATTLALSVRGLSAGPTFAGVPLSPGATVRANVPLSDLEKSYVSEGGNAVPSHTVAVLAVPRGFDPKKSWPVLLPFASSDNLYPNSHDLLFYRKTALAEGWVLLAGDGPTPAPRVDSSGWRAGHTLAALDALHRSFPGSERWPLACFGQSGGAKRASYLAPLFAIGGYRVIGIFLEGLNEDKITEGCRRFKPPASFFLTPIFLSSGEQDKIATLNQQFAVENSMRETGFKNIRHRTFPGGHWVEAAHIREALRWFRSGIKDRSKVVPAKQ